MYFSGGTTIRRFYVYISGAWNWVQWNAGSTGASGDTWWIHDADSDTYVTTEGTGGWGDSDLIIGQSKGKQIFSADSAQFAVNSHIKLGLDSHSGNTYYMWDTQTTYLQVWCSGNLRAEF
jgi:hypothetical protein